MDDYFVITVLWLIMMLIINEKNTSGHKTKIEKFNYSSQFSIDSL